MKKLNWMRWAMLLAGILFIVIGVWTIFTPVANLVGIALMISIMMLASGISEIMAYFGGDQATHSGWVLAGGILSVVFGIWLMVGQNTLAMAAVLPFVFAAWVASAGMLRAVGSFSLKEKGGEYWGWVLALGILETILGFVLMYFPVLSTVVITILLSALFITHGINDMAVFGSMTRARKLVKKAEAVAKEVVDP